MPPSEQIRISLIAPSGSGKSTAAQIIKRQFENRGCSVQVIKLAQPLYEIQSIFYEKSQTFLATGRQDQRLLELIATEMRAINPQSLINNFRNEIINSHADILINDDLRNDQTDFPYLVSEGFKVVRIATNERKRIAQIGQRNDISVQEKSPLDLQIARIRANYVLVNNASIEELEFQTQGLVDALLSKAGR